MTDTATSNDAPSSQDRALRVGVLGDGQLARMMAPAAIELGIELKLLAGSPESSAAQVIAESTPGDYRDADAVVRFARGLDVVTFDHEHVPADVLAALEAEGIAMHPKPAALTYAQDKLRMRAAVDGLGLPNPAWAEVRSVQELTDFAQQHGWPVVLKTPRGGYDGKGVRVVRDHAAAEQTQDWFDRAAASGTSGLLAEEAVPFVRELSAQVARSASGEIRSYPVVESTQTDGVCDEVIAPAPHTAAELLEHSAAIAATVAEKLDVTGMLAVELFEVGGGGSMAPGIYVNELAMRPHNSGHWSMDGAITGQFEQHLRAVLGLPLGETNPVGGAGGFTVMKNLLGGSNPHIHAAVPAAMACDPGAKIHLYGKEARPGRKIGHVNLVSQLTSQDRAEDAAAESAAGAVRLQHCVEAARTVAALITEGDR
ncbi:MAG TPA: 5-(carboxyamino)imidazole ribonucleotide synthase [Candidatus Nesterenkonia stercoripullorum]|uniref:N5-carboxyaminoimidazole ribonucleotide synthase n=1 Tax=Candidatus Nesterenkonia stercoripullorum TaxID=2838701 RepID=A0A9D1S1B1_9MICC|nr:5-(carboxyamino)imidazole ribonucleotide synthase [Candidatus Nesterenkonia stercoripullorum]